MKCLNLITLLLFVIITNVFSQYDWIRCESGTINDLNHVVWNGHSFIATGEDSSIFISDDGIEWEKRDIGLSIPYAVIAYNSRDGKTLVSSGDSIYMSDDQELWEKYMKRGYTGCGIIWGDDEYIAFGQGQINRSSDGINWNSTLPDSTPGYWMYDATWTGEKYLVVSDFGYNYLSSNGSDWLNYSGKGLISTVTWMNGKFIGCQGNFVKTSIDGINWESKKLPVLDTSSRVAYVCKVRWTGKLLIYLSGLYIATSPDGENWTPQNCKIPYEDRLKFNDVAFNDSVFVAVGNKGLIATSKIETVSNSLEKDIVKDLYNFGLQILDKKLIVTTKKGNVFSAEIFNVMGKSVRKYAQRDISAKKVVLDINEKGSHLSDGWYVLKIKLDKMQYSRRFIYVN